MSTKTRDRIRRATVLFMVSAFIAALVMIIVASKLIFDEGIKCPFYELFGWNCPGCGGTRMAVAILHLDFYQAFRWNPYVFLTLPILIVVYIWQSYVFIKDNILLPWIDKFLVGYTVGLLVFAVLRNIGIFTWLSPTLVR